MFAEGVFSFGPFVLMHGCYDAWESVISLFTLACSCAFSEVCANEGHTYA